MSRRLLMVIALFACASLSSAQQPKVLAPHRPVAPRVANPEKPRIPAVPRSMVGGLWMVDANFKSSILLRNDLKTDSLTVTPILWLSNGRNYALRDVTLEPSGTAVVSVNDGLAQQGIAPWATLYGYVEVQYHWAWDPICVTVQNTDAVHSLIFTYFLRPSLASPVTPASTAANQTVNVSEGMWWKQESNVTGFITLSNVSSQLVHAAIQVSDNQAQVFARYNAAVSSHSTKLINLRELESTTEQAGGIRISYDGAEEGLVIIGGLQDQAAGYSATMPFRSPPSASDKVSDTSFAELGLMMGAADPMMLFPAGATFTPYSVLRNVSDQPVSVTPTLYWMEGGRARSTLSRP
jgi:hypothetical protein